MSRCKTLSSSPHPRIGTQKLTLKRLHFRYHLLPFYANCSAGGLGINLATADVVILVPVKLDGSRQKTQKNFSPLLIRWERSTAAFGMFYPKMKLGQILVSIEAKPDCGAATVDFNVTNSVNQKDKIVRF
ncbi:hypothetical protein RIF29_33143 [Crotalaria pallida]|uniref:Uncharacterized protein n=1 Tax=Crotalaria pallida TaxID=3830 RepID=A0AAN9E8L7_CROPI